LAAAAAWLKTNQAADAAAAAAADPAASAADGSDDAAAGTVDSVSSSSAAAAAAAAAANDYEAANDDEEEMTPALREPRGAVVEQAGGEFSDHPPGQLNDGTPAFDGKCVFYSLKMAAEIIFGTAHATLITVSALGKMLPLDLSEKIVTGHTKSDGSSWYIGDCGTAGESWSENCVALLLKAIFGNKGTFELIKLKELSVLVPPSEFVPDDELGEVYLVSVDLFPQSGGLIDDEGDGDNNHMVLVVPLCATSSTAHSTTRPR
jgi:hypothetical protein